MENRNRRILIVSIKKCKKTISIILIGFVVLLTGCGQASTTVDLNGKNGTGLNNKDKDQPTITSAQVSAETFIIDLNNSDNVNVDISLTFKDGSSTSKTYILRWNAVNVALQLSDSESNVLDIEYDSNTLKNSTSTVLTIKDNIFPETINLTISLIPENVIALDVTYKAIDLKIGETAVFSLSATLKNRKVITDAISIATCFDDSVDKNIIEVQNDCSVKRIANGDAVVSAKLNRAQAVAPTVNKFSFSATTVVIDPVVILLEVAYSGANLIVGAETQLTLSGTLNNNQLITDATNIARCIDLSSDTELLIIITGCRVQGLKEGRAIISAELFNPKTNKPQVVNLEIDIKLPPSTIEKIDLLYLNSPSVTLTSGDTIDVKMRMTWTVGVPTTETVTVACTSNSDDESILVLLDGCQISAFRPGTYQIALNPNPAIVGVTLNTAFFPLEVIVNPKLLSETVNGSGVYDVDIPAGVTDILMALPNINQGIYKVKMISDNALTEYEMGLATYDIFDTASISSNILCFNIIFPQKKSLACGVSKSILGEVYVELQRIPPSGFLGKLNLTPDANIFLSDNNGINIPNSKNDYMLLSLGQNLAGHVSTNGLKNNNSRYYIDDMNGLPDATSYTVTITFDPDSDDANLTNFNQNNVLVGWILNSSDSQPTIRCSYIGGNPPCSLAINGNSLVYTIFGSKVDIYITIFGSGSDIINGSPATADGELSYTIRLDSN